MNKFDLSINVTSEVVGGQVYFNTSFNRPLNAVEQKLIGDFTVNLSRGGDRQYALNNLKAHNGGGATWNTGASGTHGTIAQTAYRNRVMADLSKSWEAFKAAVIKANTPVVTTAPSTGSQVFFSANGS